MTARRSRRWWGLAVLALPTLLSAVDMNVLFLALPHLTRDLAASAVEQLWITDVYGFLVAGLVITMGTLGDRVGHRRLLFAGAAVFAVTSVAAAYAPDPTVLVALRALLGVAGATLMPATLALITGLFADGRERGVAIAVWATCQFAGAALGPVAGGLLLGHFWWGSVFLLAVPVMLVLLAAGSFVLPAGTGDGSGRLDLTSVTLSLLAVLPVIWGVKVAATGSAPTVVATAAVVAGVAVGGVFVRRQLHLERPLLDLALFRRRRVTVLLAALVGAGVAMAGTGMLVTQYLQTVLGYAPVATALWFAPMGLGVAAGTLLTPVVVRRVRPHVAIAGGLVLSALGALLLVLTPAADGAPVAVGAVTVLALGTGPLFAQGIGAVVGAVPSSRAGAAASLAETGNYLGGALGLALLGTLAAASYRAAMRGTEGLARETVSGATAAARALPAPQAGELLAAAREAFTGGVHLVGVVAAVLFAGLAVATSRITLDT